MSLLRQSMQDKRELEKRTRVLALKVAQVIVQSRLGEKIRSECKADSSSDDWFNLAIRDSPEILAETKRSLREELTSSPVPLCIEISVNTVEGHSTVLETWSLGVVSEQSSTGVKLTNTVIYNRMGMLLKSLLTVSRMTPAYKISRRQNPESYVICYRIFMGEPQPHSLGDACKHVRVGQLRTDAGTIHLSVSYRTKVTFSPSRLSPDNISLKSDHFQADTSPPNGRWDEKIASDTPKVGAFVADKQRCETPVSETEDVPFGFLLSMRKTPSPPAVDPDATITPESVTAADTCDGNEPPSNDPPKSEPKSSSTSMTSANDFIMVDLKSPFATANTKNDLGTFYRECQNAPQLKTFEGEQTLEEQIGDLTKQLENFETNMQLYDDLVDTLCKSKNQDC